MLGSRQPQSIICNYICMENKIVDSAVNVFITLSAWDHRDFDASRCCKGEVYLFDPFSGITIFYATEFLEQANDSVACFSESKLLANAYT